jgi:hypothetical protein
MLGERRKCEKALEAADVQFAQIQPGDPAIDLFSPTQPGRLAGSCYLFLRDAKGAAAILEEQPRPYRTIRSRKPSSWAILPSPISGSVNSTRRLPG